MKIIGLAGTNGSGKDSVAEILAKNHNYLFVSVSDLLRKEAELRSQPVERETLRTISAEWRREHGLGVLIDKAVAYYELQKQSANYDGLVVASLRNPGEADRLHELGGQVIWVDADQKVRYNRIFSRQRTSEDNKTFEQFQAEEQAEMRRGGDEATLSMGEVKSMVNRTFINNGSDLVGLEERIAKEILDITE